MRKSQRLFRWLFFADAVEFQLRSLGGKVAVDFFLFLDFFGGGLMGIRDGHWTQEIWRRFCG